MITEDLIAYIQTQIRKNTSKDTIASRLRNAGWHDLDIEEALRKVAPPEPVVSARPTSPTYIEPVAPISEKETYKVSEQYRELPEANIQEKTPTIDNSINTLATSPSEIVAPVSKPIARRPEPVMYVIPETDLQPPKKAEPIAQAPVRVEPKPKVEEVIPTLIPKEQVKLTVPVAKPSVGSTTLSSLPKSALISSYAEDLSVASMNQNKSAIRKIKTPIKIAIIIIILSIVGGVVFAAMPQFIKKDTKTLLLSAPITFGILESYKSQTKASLSIPSFANITAGLVSGEVVSSTDIDSIAVHTEGLINQHNGMTTSSKYHMTLTSSIWQDDLTTDIFYDGIKSYINIPSLVQILGKNAPVAQTVSVQKGKFKSLAPLFPPYLQSYINMADVDKLLLKGVDPYTNTDTGLAFKEFISTSDVIEKSSEVVSGAPTYHYQINADKQTTKKLLNSLATFFLVNSSDENTKLLEENLGTITLDSFEV